MSLRRQERGSISPLVLVSQAEMRLRAEIAAQGHELLLMRSVVAIREDSGQLRTILDRLPDGAPDGLDTRTRAKLATGLRDIADVLDPPELAA